MVVMKKLNIVKEAKIINVAAAGCIFISGLIMLIIRNPHEYQQWMLGALCILLGGAKLLGYFSNDLYRLAFQFDLTLGIFAGVLHTCPVGSEDIVNAYLPAIFGVYVILDGALKIQIAIDAKKFGM